MVDIDFNKCPKQFADGCISCFGCPYCLPSSMRYDGNICPFSYGFMLAHPLDAKAHFDFLKSKGYEF